MTKLLEWIHKQGRCCLHCGSFGVDDSQFCSICQEDLWQKHPTMVAIELPSSYIWMRALFEWYPDEDRKVSKLMVDLKGGEPRAAYRFYARMLVSRMKYLELPSNTVLLPCPSTRRKDHAKALAIELSQILGVPVVQALMTEKSHKSQKQKSRSEREKIVFQKTASLRRKHVIFIDDIVTTGATAKAAKKALGLTEGFEVWCLAHRRQLATDLGF